MLTLEHVALAKQGSTATVHLRPGQMLGLFGPAASGKSQLLAAIAGREAPPRGLVTAERPVTYVGPRELSRRIKVQQVLRQAETNAATKVLTELRLWDSRAKSVGQLSDSQAAALVLAEAIAMKPMVLAIDSLVDSLDPWTFTGLERLLLERKRTGLTTVIACNRLEIAAMCDAMILLDQKMPIFVGEPIDLLTDRVVSEIIVKAGRVGPVESIVKPFRVKVRQVEGGLELSAEEGQELAARLLAEGYGTVETVFIRSETIAQAILARLP
jgi:ABC-type cobalamin/Fe3+-siderophores transport system ATPase subunit